MPALVFLAIASGLLVHFGFDVPDWADDLLLSFIVVLGVAYVVREVRESITYSSLRAYWEDRWFEALISTAMVVYPAFWPLLHWLSRVFAPEALEIHLHLLWLGGLGLLAFFTTAVERLQLLLGRSNLPLRTPQILVLSFMAPIAFGAALLKMPNSTVNGISWVDAIFTATSAVCVTGLSSVDIAKEFTPLGQFFVICLIQIGGLGIMTLTITFASFFVGSMGIRERLMMADFLSEDRIGEIRSLLARIAYFTFGIEAIGAVYLYLAAGGSFLAFDGPAFLTAAFHAISAFCNAGFALLSQNFFDPAYRDNYTYAGGIMALIILGSIGFPVLSNLVEVLQSPFSRSQRHRILTTSSKLVLASTAVLLVVGSLVIWLLERQASFSSLTESERLFQSAFLAVTTRTAGFNLWPTEQLSGITALVVILLMWIGGSPMSCAGGVKSTTIAIAFLTIRSQVFGMSRIEAFGRQISPESVTRSYAAIATSIVALFVGALIVLFIERDKNQLDCVFEVVSAYATTGLSRNLTPSLTPASKLLLSLLMLIGRVGAITALSALVAPPKSANYKLLEDRVTIY